MRFSRSMLWFETLLPLAILVSSNPVHAEGRDMYFPTKIGAKWVYEYDGKEETEEITHVEKKDSSFIVTVHRVNRFGKSSDSKLNVSTEGLVRLTGGPAVVHPPMQLLKLPHKAGQDWETHTGAWLGPKGTLTAFGPEKVRVPAGKYEAIRVETRFLQTHAESVLAKYWYAPNVGLVKEQYGDHVRVLKSFLPGKD